MRIVEEEKDIVRQSVVRREECGIKFNSHSFRILSRLYSDPILAILRELGTNASESHTRAGCNDTQFIVKLPNPLDPTFSIRDFGVSMTPDTIYNIYRNYMASDKRDTNEEGGYFGLGSKTPFTYTDSFYLTCYKDGICRRYVLTTNENQIPEINEFEKTETQEPDGVEVGFTVKESDFSKFYSKAREAFRFFRFKPRFVGVSHFSIEPIKYLIYDNVTNYGGLNANRQSFVVMGDIGYPIDGSQFEDKYRRLVHSGIILNLPMGSLDLVPSREGLEYTKHTVNSIKKQCDLLFSIINRMIKDQLAKITVYWDAVIFRKNIESSLGSIANLLEIDWVTSDNREIREQVDFDFFISRIVMRQKGFRWVKSKEQSTKKRYILIDTMAQLFVDDCKGATARLRQHMKSNGSQRQLAYIIDPSNLPVVLEKTGLTVNNVTLISSLPKPIRSNSRNNDNEKTETASNFLVYDYLGNQERNRFQNSEYWSRPQNRVDIYNGTYVYVLYYRNEIANTGLNCYRLSKICSNLTKLGISLPVIYGVKKVDRIKNCHNWIPIEKFLIELFQRLLRKFDYHLALEITKNIEVIEKVKTILKHKTIAFDIVDHLFVQLLAEAGELQRHRLIVESIDLLKSHVIMEEVCENEPEKLNSCFSTISNKYPLLDAIREYDIENRELANAIVIYINAVDSYSKGNSNGR